MNYLFYFFTKENAPVHFPGISFLLAAVLMLASVLIAYYFLQKEKKIIGNLTPNSLAGGEGA
jgi:DHA1 family tetracycline resistance protein-like MFS transporter